MQRMGKYSQEQLMQEFCLAQAIPDEDIPQAGPDEFERIWERIQEGEEKKTVE